MGISLLKLQLTTRLNCSFAHQTSNTLKCHRNKQKREKKPHLIPLAIKGSFSRVEKKREKKQEAKKPTTKHELVAPVCAMHDELRFLKLFF